METLILPGFSLKNKEWADLTAKELGLFFPTKVIEWEHWQTGVKKENWIQTEVEKIIKEVGDEKVNIIAKSIGTLVAMQVLQVKPELINKLVLCGVPLHDISETDRDVYGVIKDFPEEDILCIQNQNDNHGTFTEAESFVHRINPEIQIVSKPREDHEYPYAEDFLNFLKL